MDKLSTNSCDLDKSFKKHNNISSSELFTCPYSLIMRRCHSFSNKITSDLSSQNSTAQSIKKFNSPKNIRKRKDIFGNVIEKGGKQKISFRDNFKGKFLVEMTLIDPKQNSLRGKNYKNYTIFREARDKEEVLCSGACNIF